ncbi:MAG: cell division protein ZapA [Candidatus Zixiibacteriota bacterium]
MSDSCVENKVIVKIFGEEYPITGVSDPAHIYKVAEYVDAKMREVARISRSKARDKVAILTALTIASELDETIEQLRSVTDSRNTEIDGLLTRLDKALTHEPLNLG